MEQQTSNILDAVTFGDVYAWYALRVHMGFEDTVAGDLQKSIETFGLQEDVKQILIPKEKIVRIKNGKRTEQTARIYPGFVIMHMKMSERISNIVGSIEHSMGFLGTKAHPVMFDQKEIDSMFERMKDTSGLKNTDIGLHDVVIIAEGPFAKMTGQVVKIDLPREQLTVSVNMFGRATPVKLALFQVKKI
ncbi:MAG: transcription termination/antitermination protein NusG [Alphaproteobacteria bacterium]|nr:transcription termination/antitermination protein NusG [Alphaproteobacteria bacterium]